MFARLTHNQTLSARISFLSDILSGLAANNRTFGIFYRTMSRFSTIGTLLPPPLQRRNKTKFCHPPKKKKKNLDCAPHLHRKKKQGRFCAPHPQRKKQPRCCAPAKKKKKPSFSAPT